MKTFSEFQESAASIALKGGVKLLPKIVKVAPKLKTFTKFSTAIPVGLGIAGALKSKKEDEDDIKGDNQNRPEYQLEPGDKTVYDVKPEKLQDFPNQKDYLDKVSADLKAKQDKIDSGIKAQRDGEGTLTYRRRISGGTYKNKNKSKSNEARDREKIRQQWLKDNNLPPDSNAQPPGFNEEALAAPTNSVGGGQIAGTVEAGDDPPVKKKKRYIYGGRGSRKNWMA